MISFDYNTDYYPPMPVILAEVTNPGQESVKIACTALIDTGADGTMLPLDFLEQINAPLVGNAVMRGVLGAGEQVDVFLIRVKIGSFVTGGIRAVAMPIGSEPILGHDILNQFIVALNGLANIVEISS